MKFNLDEIAQQTPVWDFTVTIDGFVYDTTEPTEAEVAQMPGMKPDLAKMREMAKRYINNSGPPDEAWTDRRLAAFMHGYLNYLASFLKKRRELADANINLQFERQGL